MNIITKKRAYTCPKTIIISTGCDSLMQSASGNAGSIGFGGSGGDAKQWFGFWDEEEDGDDSFQEGKVLNNGKKD